MHNMVFCSPPENICREIANSGVGGYWDLGEGIRVKIDGMCLFCDTVGTEHTRDWYYGLEFVWLGCNSILFRRLLAWSYE